MKNDSPDPRGDGPVIDPGTLENGQPNIIDYSNDEPLLFGLGENSSHDYPGKIVINNESRYVDRAVKHDTTGHGTAATGEGAVGSDRTQPTLPTGAPLPDHNMSGLNFNDKIDWNETIKLDPMAGDLKQDIPAAQAFTDEGNNPHITPEIELELGESEKLGKPFPDKSDTGDDLSRTGPGGENPQDNYDMENYQTAGDNIKLNIATPLYDDRRLHDVSGIVPELQDEDDKIRLLPDELKEDIMITDVYQKEEKSRDLYALLIAAGLIVMTMGEFQTAMKSGDYQQLKSLKKKAKKVTEDITKVGGVTIPKLKPYDFVRYQYNRQENCPICKPLDKLEFWIDDPKRPIVPSENLGRGVYNTHPNCFPGNTIIENPDGVLSTMRTLYCGLVVKLFFSNGENLTVTPNHLLLTPEGFICADLLSNGDKVINRTFTKRKPSTIYPNNHRKPTTIKEIFDSLTKSRSSSSLSVPSSPEYLHGDAKFSNGNIDIVRPNRLLRFARKASFLKHSLTNILNWRNSKLFPLSSNSSLVFFLYRALTSTDRSMSSTRESEPIFLTHPRHTDNLSLSMTSNNHSSLLKSSLKSRSTDTKSLTQSLKRFSSIVETNEIIDIKITSFHGYVYDIQTPSSLYFANNTLVSNCKCSNIPFIKLLNDDEAPKSINKNKSQVTKDSLAERVRITKEYLRPLEEAINYREKAPAEFDWIGKETIKAMEKHAATKTEKGRFILAVVSGESYTDHRIEGKDKHRRHWTEDELRQNIRTGKGKLIDINHLMPKKDPYSGGIFDANWNETTHRGEMVLFEQDEEILNAIRRDIITAVSINTGPPRAIELNCDSGECLLEPRGTHLGNHNGVALSYVVTSPQGFDYNGQWLYPLPPGMKFTKLYLVE